MGKVRLTLSIDENLVKKFKHKAIDEGKTVSQLVEELMKKKLGEK
jgi:metal-responsive CopG/Arc/MetJ family transcriptional regulator